MLRRFVVLESALTVDDCLSRLSANTRKTPAWATWWTWPRDAALWGSYSNEGFRMQLGRTRQLVSATGRFAGAPERTLVNVALDFHRWLLPYLVVSAVLVVVIGFVIDKVSTDPSFAVLASALAAFGLFANLAFGLLQQRDLLRALERLLEARPVERHSRP